MRHQGMESHRRRLSTWDHPRERRKLRPNDGKWTRSKTKSQVGDPDKTESPEVGGTTELSCGLKCPQLCPHPKAPAQGLGSALSSVFLRSQYHGEALGCGPAPGTHGAMSSVIPLSGWTQETDALPEFWSTPFLLS